MKIAVRMDDITPGMDMKKFWEFYNMLKKKNITPLLGVVPNNQDSNLNIDTFEDEESFWSLLKELKDEGCMIAMHGYDHIYNTSNGGIFPLNNFSEFAGNSYEKQLNKIKAGKKILDSHAIFTDIFMAPGHSYDKVTLDVLKEIGFAKVTDGFGNKPYEYKGLKFLPISFRQQSSLKKKKGVTTFVVHSNMMKVNDFERWDNMLKQEHNVEWINYSELLEMQAKKRSEFGMMIERIVAMLKHILVKI